MDSLSTISSHRHKPTGQIGIRERAANQQPLLVLLLIAGITYFWDLSINGWGNPYYAAAAQAASQNWTALFFGSTDAGNAMSVDKPPLHIWVLALSVKIFGLSHFSVLAPQALMGIGTVALVYKTISFVGKRLAFMSALAVILTPVSTMMFRFNNPDALLLLLWALTSYLLVKSIQTSSPLHLHIAAFTLGCGFLCKQFQSWIMVPAVIIAYLVVRPGGFVASVRRLALAAAALAAPAVTWMSIVYFTPSDQRPWVGGSPNNNILELTFGYNGLGRLTGQTNLGATNPKDFEGVVGYDASITRLMSVNYAPEIAWLLPLAVVGGVLVAFEMRRTQNTPLRRFVLLFMLSWFATAFGLLSFMTGDIHPYYTSMLTIPLAFLAAYAAEQYWTHRSGRSWRTGAALVVLFSVFMDSGYLTWFQDWAPWIGFTIKVAALAAAILLALPKTKPWINATASGLSALALLLLPLSFIVESNSAPQQGSFPLSGPVPSVESWHRRDAEQLRLGEREKYSLARGEPVVPEVERLLEAAPVGSTWAGATTGSENAALYQLSTGRPVMAIGGFSAGDAYPSLNTFRELVDQGRITYYIHQPGILKWAASSPNISEVVEWITTNFEHRNVDGVEIYDLRRL